MPVLKRSMAEEAMRAKRHDYFACGTLVVWDVDLLSEDVVKVYRASAPDIQESIGVERTQRQNRPCQGGGWP